MKKLMSLLLVCVMALTLFGGCTNDKETASSGDVQKLVIWSGDSHSKNFYLEKVDEFNKTLGKELGIKVEYIVKSSVSQEIDLSFVSGQAPDLMTGTGLTKYAGEGYIAAFEDIEGGEKYIEKFKDFIVPKKNMANGKTYTMPYSCTTTAIVYNKDMFKAAGIVDENGEAKAPVTWDDVIEYAEKLTNVKKQEFGFIYNAKDGANWYGDNVAQPVSSNGGWRDGYNPYTGEYDFSSHGDIMKKVMEIRNGGWYVPGAEGLNNDAARARFAAGNVGMKMAQSFDYAVYTEQFPAEIDWGVAPYPVLNEGEFHGQFCTFTGGWMINKDAVEKFGDEKILKVYDWFISDEFMIDLYKAGMAIPYNYELIKDVKLEKGMENWKEFADMLAISYNAPQYLAHEVDVTGVEKINESWDKIWAGEIPVSQIDKICNDYSKAYNDGKKKYLELHPDYKVPELVSEDYVIYSEKK